MEFSYSIGVVISRGTMTQVLMPLTVALKRCLTLNGLCPVNNGERIAEGATILTSTEKSRNSAVIQRSNVNYVTSCRARRGIGWLRFGLPGLEHRFSYRMRFIIQIKHGSTLNSLKNPRPAYTVLILYTACRCFGGIGYINSDDLSSGPRYGFWHAAKKCLVLQTNKNTEHAKIFCF